MFNVSSVFTYIIFFLAECYLLSRIVATEQIVPLKVSLRDEPHACDLRINSVFIY